MMVLIWMKIKRIKFHDYLFDDWNYYNIYI
jgi:hypothetical protein